MIPAYINIVFREHKHRLQNPFASAVPRLEMQGGV